MRNWKFFLKRFDLFEFFLHLVWIFWIKYEYFIFIINFTPMTKRIKKLIMSQFISLFDLLYVIRFQFWDKLIQFFFELYLTVDFLILAYDQTWIKLIFESFELKIFESLKRELLDSLSHLFILVFLKVIEIAKLLDFFQNVYLISIFGFLKVIDD